MRIVVAGASALGRAAARHLIAAGHEVVVIDRDRAVLDRMSDKLDCGLIEGDATLPSILREAAGDRFDALVAVTNSDEDNILCAVVGRSIGFDRVVPQIIKPELCAICDELSLDDVVTPHETVAAGLTDLLGPAGAGKDSAHDAHLSGELRLASVTVSASMADTAVSDLPIAGSARALVVRRGDTEALVEPSTVLREGDELILLAARKDAKSLISALKSEIAA